MTKLRGSSYFTTKVTAFYRKVPTTIFVNPGQCPCKGPVIYNGGWRGGVYFLKPCNFFIPLHTFHKIFHTPTGNSQNFSYPYIWATVLKYSLFPDTFCRCILLTPASPLKVRLLYYGSNTTEPMQLHSHILCKSCKGRIPQEQSNVQCKGSKSRVLQLVSHMRCKTA